MIVFRPEAYVERTVVISTPRDESAVPLECRSDDGSPVFIVAERTVHERGILCTGVSRLHLPGTTETREQCAFAKMLTQSTETTIRVRSTQTLSTL